MRTSTFYIVIVFSTLLLFSLAAFSSGFADSALTNPLFNSFSRLHRIVNLQGITSPQDDGCCDEQQLPKPAISQGTEDITLESYEPAVLASDPRYSILGPVGLCDFIVSREGPPRRDELTNENLLKIVLLECTDLEVRLKACAIELIIYFPCSHL